MQTSIQLLSKFQTFIEPFRQPQYQKKAKINYFQTIIKLSDFSHQTIRNHSKYSQTVIHFLFTELSSHGSENQRKFYQTLVFLNSYFKKLHNIHQLKYYPITSIYNTFQQQLAQIINRSKENSIKSRLKDLNQKIYPMLLLLCNLLYLLSPKNKNKYQETMALINELNLFLNSSFLLDCLDLVFIDSKIQKLFGVLMCYMAKEANQKQKVALLKKTTFLIDKFKSSSCQKQLIFILIQTQFAKYMDDDEIDFQRTVVFLKAYLHSMQIPLHEKGQAIELLLSICKRKREILQYFQIRTIIDREITEMDVESKIRNHLVQKLFNLLRFSNVLTWDYISRSLLYCSRNSVCRYLFLKYYQKISLVQMIKTYATKQFYEELNNLKVKCEISINLFEAFVKIIICLKLYAKNKSILSIYKHGLLEYQKFIQEFCDNKRILEQSDEIIELFNDVKEQEQENIESIFFNLVKINF